MTDPARTTKDERDGLRAIRKHHAGSSRVTLVAIFADRLLDDADAADALRAQVAALQAENERISRREAALANWNCAESGCALPDGYTKEAEAYAARFAEMKAELAAAQAKLAVPVDEDVRRIAVMLGQTTCEMSNANVAANNARTTGTFNDWCGTINEGRRALEALARDNAALRTKAEALERERDGLIARQKPMDSDIAAIVAEHRSELYDAEKP